jgi:hypothetical protein
MMLARVSQGPAGLQKTVSELLCLKQQFFWGKILHPGNRKKGVATGVKGFLGKTWTHVAIFRQ